MTIIYCEEVPEGRRLSHTAALFGLDFPMRLEPFVFNVATPLSRDYRGGFWKFCALSNGGFYMAPDSESIFNVSCQNGFEGSLSGDAFGIAVCLYAYSNLSFSGDAFAEKCTEHFHLLREYMLDHAEARAILAAID